MNSISALRQARPLVHNLTNYVAMNWTANCLLAIGASPVMAHAPEESADMAGLASALVVNIGTLSAPWVESMALAMEAARKKRIPIVLDPVGAGATFYRSRVARELLERRPTIVRANASEILALSADVRCNRGVDSSVASTAAVSAAEELARRFGCVVCVSGETDFVTDGHEVASIANGHAIMTQVTGMGCAATALIGAFAGAASPSEPMQATIAAMCAAGIAGEIAKEACKGPGSFQFAFLDALASLTDETLQARSRVDA